MTVDMCGREFFPYVMKELVNDLNQFSFFHELGYHHLLRLMRNELDEKS